MIGENCNYLFNKYKIEIINLKKKNWVEKLLELKERENTASSCVGRRSIGPIVDHEKGTGLNGIVKGFWAIALRKRSKNQMPR